MLRRDLTPLAAALLLSACALLDRPAAEPAAGATPLPPIPAHALQAHYRFLADDLLAGRMSGEPGHEIAARYVASQFRQIGLTPAGGADPEQGEDAYLRPVPLLAGQLDIAASQLVLHGVPGGDTLRFRDDYVVYANLGGAQRQVRAPLVFAGHGVVAPSLGHDDYAGLDVAGKIVVTFPRAPKSFPADERAFYSSVRRKAREAAARGAVGMLSIRSDYARKRYAWADTARNAGTQPTMRWTDAAGQPADYTPQIRASATLADHVAPRLFVDAPTDLETLLAAEAAGEPLPRFPLGVEASIRTQTTLSALRSPNVVARLPGQDPALAGEHMVLVAHLDHLGVGAPVDGDAIYNGAYDNAMGIALLIETARALAASGTRRSVLFAAVTAEERGLLGSHYLARNPPAEVERMVAAITLDMPLLLFPMREVIGFGAEHSNLDEFVRAAAGAEDIALAPDPMPDEVLFIRSDHYSFVREGVPGLFFFPGFASADPDVDGEAQVYGHLATHYHKPSDDLSRPVHWPSAERFARINARLARGIANSEQPPQWVPGNFFAAQFVRD